MNRKIRTIPFILLAIVAIVLAVASIFVPSKGNDAIVQEVYTSWWMMLLWGVLALTAVWVVVRSDWFFVRKKKVDETDDFGKDAKEQSGRKIRWATLLLHCSFVVILLGAAITHFGGRQGTVHLRVGENQTKYTNSETGRIETLPFALRLDTFEVLTYAGTQSPLDFVSKVEIVSSEKNEKEKMTVSMNNIGQSGGYRFYQSSYDSDQRGTTLCLSYDPLGIGFTYGGYALLFLSMLLLLVLPHEGFRPMLRRYRRSLAALCLLFLSTGAALADNAPKTLPRDAAESFGRLYVYHNGRVCPMKTLARDFTMKLCGSATYKGMTAEQVFCGWMFFPTDWVSEPMIKVKSSVGQLLGGKNNYLAYVQFHDQKGYRLQDALDNIHYNSSTENKNNILQADEKMNMLLMLFNRQLLKIFPVWQNVAENAAGGKQLVWNSPDNRLPNDFPENKIAFVRKSFDYAGELIWMERTDDLISLFEKIRQFQEKEAKGYLPSASAFRAELFYDSAEKTRPAAMTLLGVGLLACLAALGVLGKLRNRKFLWRALLVIAALATFYLLTMMGLRGYISGHLPLANGFETMQFMAFCALCFTLFLYRLSDKLFFSFGLLLSGLCLLVSMMGESSPQITPLMPVLISPLLSIHVCIIMLGYTLLAFLFLNSLVVLTRSRRMNTEEQKRTTALPYLLLYVAEFCLAAGIFIGAIWANQSWGRYWGWDPKEVWALISLIVYAFPLHRTSLPFLRRPVWFHLYLVLAFSAILMTYFGVNFLLGGMHSYA